MDSSVQIKGIKLMQIFNDYDLAIFHCYEIMEIYYITQQIYSTDKQIAFWKYVIDYLTEEKRKSKTKIDEVVQVNQEKFLWLNVWYSNLINEYFVTTHTREDLADKVMDDELTDNHIVKLKIEL